MQPYQPNGKIYANIKTAVDALEKSEKCGDINLVSIQPQVDD